MTTSERGRVGSRTGFLLLVGAVAAVFGATGAVLWAVRDESPAPSMEPPRFLAETATGIDHVYDGEWTFFVGGGVAVFDCNDDLKPDLYVAGGVNQAGLYLNESPIGGGLRFSRLDSPVTDLAEVTGAYPLDIDGDERTDLAVLRLGENVLLRGVGDCRFEPANDEWSLDGGDAWTAAFSAKWEGSSTLPTLAFGNYVALDENDRQTAACSDNVLVRPDGDDLRFPAPSALSPGWCTLSILFSDWSRSGPRDLRITNDRHYYRDGEEQLWRIDGGAQPHLYTRDEGWQKMQIWGMGIASQDLTGDGMPEIFLTSQGDNKLQTLVEGADGPSYSDIAIRRGVTAHRPFTGGESLPSTAWHAEFQDVNNDSFVDLFVAKGNVEAMPEFAARDPSNLLMGQPDGTFVEAAAEAGMVSFTRSRGAALVDLNLDGMLDVVIVNRRAPVEIWRNIGWSDGSAPRAMGNWVAVRLEQPAPNPDAIGSWIEIEIGDSTIHREVTIGGGHAGGQLGWVHFGLGNQEQARLRVQWPDGDIGSWIELDSNEFAFVERGASEARSWSTDEG